MTTVNDVILIHLEDTPVSFARVESILPDAKKDWYQIKLLMLHIPLQTVTWILKDDYINGMEFQMNGKRMQLKKVECPVDESATAATEPGTEQGMTRTPDTHTPDTERSNTENKNNVISFSDFKKES